MKLEYYGHSFWRIVTEELKVVIDPFDNIGYPMPANLEADYVVISHEHHDHNNTSIVKGNPQVIRTPGIHVFPDITVTLFSCYHDEVHGVKRGVNNIIKLETEGLTLVHCGDLGHVPVQEILEQIKQPDMLLVPVGEVYTLGLSEVFGLLEALQPRLVFPMHYQTSPLGFVLGSLDTFLVNLSNVVRHKSNTLEITPDLLASRKTIIMNWSLQG